MVIVTCTEAMPRTEAARIKEKTAQGFLSPVSLTVEIILLTTAHKNDPYLGSAYSVCSGGQGVGLDN